MIDKTIEDDIFNFLPDEKLQFKIATEEISYLDMSEHENPQPRKTRVRTGHFQHIAQEVEIIEIEPVLRVLTQQEVEKTSTDDNNVDQVPQNENENKTGPSSYLE